LHGVNDFGTPPTFARMTAIGKSHTARALAAQNETSLTKNTQRRLSGQG